MRTAFLTVSSVKSKGYVTETQFRHKSTSGIFSHSNLLENIFRESWIFTNIECAVTAAAEEEFKEIVSSKS